jgi:hypothetical protein
MKGMQMPFDHQFFATLNCPNNVTWTNDIKQMFTPLDIDHMKKAKNIDLGNYASVKLWAAKIYEVVASGQMPPPGSGEPRWPQAKVDTFGCWIQQNCPQ